MTSGREWLIWTALVVVALAIIFVGLAGTSSNNILRIAVGTETPMQVQLAEDLQRLIESETRHRVRLVETTSAREAQERLLDQKVELALLAPSALAGSRPYVTLGGIASQFAQATAPGNDPFVLGPDSLVAAGGSDDSGLMAGSLARGLGIGVDVGADTSLLVGLLRDQAVADQLTAGRTLQPIPGHRAFALANPLWQPAQLPEGVYLTGTGAAPEQELATLATPVMLVSMPELADGVVAELATALESGLGQVIRQRYQAQASAQVWPLLPQHRVLSTQALDWNQVVREQWAWWLDHKLLLGLVILGLVLLIAQGLTWRNLRRRQRRGVLERELGGLIDQLVVIDQQGRRETDLRVILQLEDDISHLKVRGTRLIVDQRYLNEPVVMVFYSQCEAVRSYLNSRLRGQEQCAAVV